MGSDDEDAAMAASQVIEAVSTVLQSTKAVPELFPAMEAHLLPMLVEVRLVLQKRHPTFRIVYFCLALITVNIVRLHYRFELSRSGRHRIYSVVVSVGLLRR